MKTFKPTRADKAHYEDLLAALNEAYLDGKPMSRVLELITIRRWQIIESYETRLIKANQRIKELETGILKHVES